MLNKKGIVLILIFSTIAVLSVIGAVMMARSVGERSHVKRAEESNQAFWLAEAGINRGLAEIGNLSSSAYNSFTGTDVYNAGSGLGNGNYSVNVGDVEIEGRLYKNITAYGFIPGNCYVAGDPDPVAGCRASRVIGALVRRFFPEHFYDNAIYSAGDIDLNGDYGINGTVRYADEIDPADPDIADGVYQIDPGDLPLAKLNFDLLRDIAESQGNLYNASRLKDVETQQDDFPVSFWYTRADDLIDNDNDGEIDEPDEWVPNINYLEGDLELKGEIDTVGGFFVVAGNVITSPDDEADATINGDGEVDGVIYTRGEFRINGGGNGLNINGGVWSGELSRLNGNATINYNQTYMDIISSYDFADVQIVNWKEEKNPYRISP